MRPTREEAGLPALSLLRGAHHGFPAGRTGSEARRVCPPKRAVGQQPRGQAVASLLDGGGHGRGTAGPHGTGRAARIRQLPHGEASSPNPAQPEDRPTGVGPGVSLGDLPCQRQHAQASGPEAAQPASETGLAGQERAQQGSTPHGAGSTQGRASLRNRLCWPGSRPARQHPAGCRGYTRQSPPPKQAMLAGLAPGKAAPRTVPGLRKAEPAP